MNREVRKWKLEKKLEVNFSQKNIGYDHKNHL